MSHTDLPDVLLPDQQLEPTTNTAATGGSLSAAPAASTVAPLRAAGAEASADEVARRLQELDAKIDADDQAEASWPDGVPTAPLGIQSAHALAKTVPSKWVDTYDAAVARSPAEPVVDRETRRREQLRTLIGAVLADCGAAATERLDVGVDPDGTVHLAGFVASAAERDAVVEAVARVAGVRQVLSDMRVLVADPSRVAVSRPVLQ